METEIIETKNGAALGIKIKLRTTPLLLIKAEKGYLACGYFNPNTIELIGDRAVIIPKVSSFSEMLNKKPVFVSKEARKLGARLNMTGREILEIFT